MYTVPRHDQTVVSDELWEAIAPLLPKQLGRGSGTTCWRRLRDWRQAGIWERLYQRLLNWLGDEAAIDWSRATGAARAWSR